MGAAAGAAVGKAMAPVVASGRRRPDVGPLIAFLHCLSIVMARSRLVSD